MISKRIKELREKKGISQRDLAEFLNMSQQAIAKWETAKAEPDINMIKTLSDYFNVSVAYLLCENDNAAPPNKPPANEKSVKWENIRVTFYEDGEGEDLSDEEKEEILDLVKFARERRRKKREEKNN